jgi:DNA-binding Lrp family transcriptional regulator
LDKTSTLARRTLYAKIFIVEIIVLFGRCRMAEAYILFNVEPGYEELIRQDLKNVKEVQEVYVSYGVYDLIVKVVAESVDQLRDLATYRLRKIKNVTSTLTLILTKK